MTTEVIPLGDEEKAYAVERGPNDCPALVRGRHTERWPFTPQDALALAKGTDNAPGDGWRVREIDATELARLRGVQEAYFAAKRTSLEKLRIPRTKLSEPRLV